MVVHAAVHVLVEHAVLAEADLVGLAVGAHREPVVVALETAAQVAHQVVPDRLGAILRNGEGNVGTVQVAQAVALQLDLGRLRLGLVGDRRGQCRGAPGLVDRHLVVVVFLQQRQGAGGQLVLVLLGVGRGDHHLRLVLREGIAVALLRAPASRGGSQAAVPGRDAAIGIAGLLRADRGEVGTQAGGLFRGQLGPGVTGSDQQRGGQGHRQWAAASLCSFHASFLVRICSCSSPSSNRGRAAGRTPRRC
ncbi:hypothetical protein D9M70_181110 [compost metagenome]